MSNENKIKLLEKADIYLKKGLFRDGLLLLKSNRFYFFFQNDSTQLKSQYFYLYGALLTYNGFHKQSLPYLKKALLSIHIDDNSEIYFLLIHSFINLNNKEMAKYYLNKLIDRPYSSFFILLSYYTCIKNNIDLDISINSLEELLPDDKDKNDIFDKLTFAIYCILTNKLESGYDLLLIELNNYSNNYFFNLIFLKIKFKLKLYEEIIEYFNINSKYLSSLELLFLYSAVLYKIGLFDQCTKVLNEILFIKNNYVKALINLGKIQNIKSHYTNAVNIFKNALKKNNLYNDNIYFNLSLSYQHLGLLNNAIGYVQKIPKDSIFYQKSIFNLMLLYYDSRKYDEAKRVFSELNKNSIEYEKYNRWEKNISSIIDTPKQLNFIKLLITLIPILLITISIIFFIIFYIYKNNL